jgi:hypothetical protein
MRKTYIPIRFLVPFLPEFIFNSEYLTFHCRRSKQRCTKAMNEDVQSLGEMPPVYVELIAGVLTLGEGVASTTSKTKEHR